MKLASIRSRLFNSDDIGGAFNDANQVCVPARILADGAGIFLRQRTASTTDLNSFTSGDECLRKLFDEVGFALHQMQRKPFS